MRRGAVTILIILLALVLFTSSVFSQPAKSTGRQADPIKVGGAMALTGVWGETGKWMKEGFDFWAQDVNKRGGLLGRPVEMIIYDNEGSADKAVTYYERAVTVDKVDLLMGSTPSIPFAAVMPLAEKYGKVFVGQGAQMQSFERGYTYSFGSPPLMGIWGNMALIGVIEDLIPKTDRPKSMAVLAMNDLASQPKRSAIIKWAEQHGMKVVVDESYNPKIIFHQIAPRIPAWVKEMGEDGNYVLAEAFWSPDLPYPGNIEINQAVRERFGLPRAPDFFALAYCWMKTLELGVQGAGTLDNEKIRDYLKSHKIDLPYGKGITFDKKGLPPPFCYAIQTTAGRNSTVWPKEVATTKFVYPRPDWSK